MLLGNARAFKSAPGGPLGRGCPATQGNGASRKEKNRSHQNECKATISKKSWKTEGWPKLRSCHWRWLQRIVCNGSNESITLSSEQVQELNAKLSLMRHDINNMLSLITAAVELIHTKPQTTERMTATLLEQPSRINNSMAKFSIEFERILGLPPT